MHASKGDSFLTNGQRYEIVEVLGPDGTPPYKVKAEDGKETIMNPGRDAQFTHHKTA